MTVAHHCTSVFDRRRRDPLWRITETLSGEGKITKQAVELFYGQIDGLIDKRMEAVKHGYKGKDVEGVDLLDLFLQTTQDKYTLGGMIFSFLSAGRTPMSPARVTGADSAIQEIPPDSAPRGS